MLTLSYRIRLFVEAALLLAVAPALAQTTPAEKATDVAARKAIAFMNNSQPDSVYAMAGQMFRSQVSPEMWRSIYQNQLSAMLPFSQMEYMDSQLAVNRYKLTGKIKLVFAVSLNEQGKFNDFLFQPYKEVAKPSSLTDQEQKTDVLARKIVSLFNRRQVDSVYLYASESFKKLMSAQTWKTASETGLYPLLPLPEPEFVSSKDGVSKYKLNQLQLLIGSDREGKFTTLGLQPYQDDAVKATKAATDNTMKTRLDSVANKVLSPYIQTKNNVGLSAAVWINGKAHYYNYGETRQGNGQLPTAHTLYDIGSITKTFTATLLAIAVAQGKVKLNTPITQLLPDSVATNPALKSITLQNLSNHTSGLPRLPGNMQASVKDLNNPYADYDTRLLFAYLKSFKPTRQPGEKYEYSNLGAGLLGVLLERVFKQPYAVLLQQYITGPAKLNETHLTLNPAQAALLAQGYNEQNAAVPSWTFKAMQAAGAIKSSATDLLNFGKQQLIPANAILAKAVHLTHQVTYTNGDTVVGLGWFILPNNMIQHSGGTGGYRSLVCVDLKKNIVVAVLTNNATNGDALGLELMNALQGANVH